MDATNNIATDLFYKIRSRFTGLKLGDSAGAITINPEEARFFDFDYSDNNSAIGHVSISLAENNSIKVYFSTGITESMNDKQKQNWYGFLKELRLFAKRRLMSFDTRDITKDNLDQRDYAFLSQHNQPKEQPNQILKPVGESIMSESTMYGSKNVSFQKLMDTRLIIKHSKAVMDDTSPGARTRNIGALFIENQDGERFKYPFIHLAGARAMQRHVANGGLPYDDIGKSIIGMSEEIAQLKSFGNYVVRNDLMNSMNNGIVEKSTSYLNSLRETIKALSKQHHYENYKSTFSPQEKEAIPDDIVEQFVDQFTVKSFKEDVKSVFPVLYKLMKESELGYDDIVEMTTTQEESQENETLTYDPFAKFEQWAMGIGEASAITSEDEGEKSTAIKELQELVGQHFPAGVDGSNAIQSLKGIIDDPQLFMQIKEASKQDPDTCVRGLVKDWLESNAPDVVEQLDFGDFVEERTQEGFNSDVDMELHQIISDDDPFDAIYNALGRDDEVGQRLQDMVNDISQEHGYHPDDDIEEIISRMADQLEAEYGDFDSEPREQNTQPSAERSPLSQDNTDEKFDDEMDKRLDVGALAEYLHSFYDRESGTFPKGPEGVCTMVGKKFGEQAEMVARKMVERMAPQQQDPTMMELSRIRELAGF